MDFLLTIDPEIAIIIGALTGLITAIGTFIIKGLAGRSKSKKDNVDNAVRLTDTMNNVIDMLEKELDATSKRITECRTTIAERDKTILDLRTKLYKAIATIEKLKTDILSLKEKLKRLG